MDERRRMSIEVEIHAIRHRLAAMGPAEREAKALEFDALAIGHEAKEIASRYQDRGDLDAAARWWAVALDHGVVDIDSVRLELQLAADPELRARFDEESERADAFFRRLFGLD